MENDACPRLRKINGREAIDFDAIGNTKNIEYAREMLGLGPDQILTMYVRKHEKCGDYTIDCDRFEVDGVDVTRELYQEEEIQYFYFLDLEFDATYRHLTEPDACSSKVRNAYYDVCRWQYERSCGDKYRFVLGEKGENTLVCLGVNPSTASPDFPDPTMKRVKHLAASNGYDGYMMINLSAERQTNPMQLASAINEDAAVMNRLHILRTLNVLANKRDGEPIDIWAAWGANIGQRDYLLRELRGIVELTKQFPCKWLSAGTTKAGHPRHPLYLPNETRLEEFDIAKYLTERTGK